MIYQILNTKTHKVKKVPSTRKVYKQLLKDGFDEDFARKMQIWCFRQSESNNYIHWISKGKFEVLMISAIAKIK